MVARHLGMGADGQAKAGNLNGSCGATYARLRPSSETCGVNAFDRAETVS
jgi:hypothetical protein